jgi:hypothetical protein
MRNAYARVNSSLSSRLTDSSLLVVLQPAVLDSRSYPPHVLLHVLAIQLRRLRVCGAVRVRIVQQALDGGQDCRDVVRRRPSVLENVEAELPVRVHVRVEHPREEFHGRGLVRVRFVKCQQEFESAVLERRVSCTEGESGIRTTESEPMDLDDVPGPKMTAFQSMMLSGHGLPEIPPGGSLDSRLKSRIRRLLQLVDYNGTNGVMNIDFTQGRSRIRLTMTVVTSEVGFGHCKQRLFCVRLVSNWSAPVSRDGPFRNLFCGLFAITNVSVARSQQTEMICSSSSNEYEYKSTEE